MRFDCLDAPDLVELTLDFDFFHDFYLHNLFFLYIKRTLADPEFSNLCDFSSFPQLYSELDSKIYGIPNKNIADLLDLSAPDGLYRVDPAAKNNPVGTYGICEVRSTDDGKGWRFVTFYATSPANIVRRNFYNSYGTTNPGWSGWLADGLPIDFTDINIELSPEQWTTSNNGLKYYNHTGWNIPSNALGVCANIMNWHGTPGNVTCSVYDNSYLQLRCEDAISWGGTIRVFYINSCLM